MNNWIQIHNLILLIDIDIDGHRRKLLKESYYILFFNTPRSPLPNTSKWCLHDILAAIKSMNNMAATQLHCVAQYLEEPDITKIWYKMNSIL